MNPTGAKEDHYEWSQTLSDIEINSALPSGITSKDLVISIKPTFISVKIPKLDLTILEGNLTHPINSEESTWTVSTDSVRVLQMQLEKKSQQTWWSSIIIGATEIDTSKIQPENSKLSDLPDDTRALVEKMMFDQQQRSLNKPDPEQLKKLRGLEEFKKAHPDFDFSNAKIQF
ncbi:hypothetical protein BB560_000358 [Smittium megazygosporum]|uniref:Nuclear movement protein nudC n=1 Tax=Smittium megazygosporum TaxID=133381 RepID=A0A2T9ZKR3_9FUNG|nr:hypothetical protein BB560_000358 [Smittium megazygosporum]